MTLQPLLVGVGGDIFPWRNILHDRSRPPATFVSGLWALAYGRLTKRLMWPSGRHPGSAASTRIYSWGLRYLQW